MHELCRPGGIFVHAVPFTVHLEHGFFNYQPNLFDALARHNSYDTLGIWVGPDWQLGSLIPWEPALLDYLSFNSKTTHLLVVVQRKRHDAPFCVPFQQVYENLIPDSAYARYKFVVDGRTVDGPHFKQLMAPPPPPPEPPPPPPEPPPPPDPLSPEYLANVPSRRLFVVLRDRIRYRALRAFGLR